MLTVHTHFEPANQFGSGCFKHSAVHNMLLMAKRKNPAAVALGRRGGKNSRKYLEPEERTALAQKAAAARWAKAKRNQRGSK